MSVQTERRQEDYLIELLSSVINQEEMIGNTARPAWGWIYKMSDYHHVASLIYYKIMWAEGVGVRKWKERFEVRYRKAIRFQEKYAALRKELAKKLEQAEVHAVFLGESAVLEYYPRPEMRMPEPLMLLVEKKKMYRVSGIMNAMNFENTGEKEGCGTWQYSETPDLKVRIAETLPFSGKKTKLWFEEMPRVLPREEGKRYIHCMNEETLYIYFICRLAEKYARGQIEIRDIVDLWLLISREGPELKWKEINEELDNIGLDIFGEYIAKLAGKWFGRMYFREDMDALGDMQTYIFSKGEEARRENESILPLVKIVADNYYRDLRKEEKEKKRAWLFPSIDYMSAFFPKLKKRPLLLPFYWILRIIIRKNFARKERIKEEKEKKEA